MHSAQHSKLPLSILITILLISSLAHITADMYVPSLPAITQAFQTDPAAVQLTLTTFMMGYSSAHLFYGPFSDRFGRRPPLLGGISISLLGSLICFFSFSVTMLIVGRLLQGLGVAVCNSVGRSLIRDLVSGSHLAKLGSHLGMVMVLITTLAPTLGGYIQHYFNWHGVFLFLFLYGCLVFFFLWTQLPETNRSFNVEATQFKVIIQNYKQLLTSRAFMGYTLCVCCAYAGLIAYVTAAPFLLQSRLGLTAVQFGWLAFIIGFAIFTSFFLNSRFVMIVGYGKMILAGNVVMLCSGLLMLFLAVLGFFNVTVIMLPIAFFCMGAGLTLSNAFPGASHPFAHIAGSAGALYGFLQILGGVISSALMAWLPESNQIPLGIVLAFFGLMAVLSLVFIARSANSDI